MKNNKDTIIQLYFIEKYKPVDIATKLNISKSAVTQILQKDDRYAAEKEIRKEQNKKKHKENTNDFIKKTRNANQFKNNVDDLILKNMHNQASAELSKGKRLNNMAYRNWNKSAYEYNSKRKGFEFRKELGRAYDVPKFIKVEV
ncbi:MAG: hypothetical protein J6J60_05835 [Clostridia bacterium]|nr:hypothetical protein [Clostridia bacterium]